MTKDACVVDQQREQRKRRVLRYLRIAFSVVCGMACLLLIALWTRSYRTFDELIGHVSATRLVGFDSMTGAFGIGTSVWPSLPPPYADYVPWRVRSFAIEDEGKSWFASDVYPESIWGLQYAPQRNQELIVRMPYWCPVVLVLCHS